MVQKSELEPTLNKSVNSAPQPTGEYEISREDAALLLDSMFSSYVGVLINPQEEYLYDTGEKGPKEFTLNDENMVIAKLEKPIFRTITKQEILNSKLNDLYLYTEGTIRSGHLKFNTDFLPKNGATTFDEVASIASKAYVLDGIERATTRLETPTHITHGSDNEDLESTRKFTEVLRGGIKELGSTALQIIQSAATIFSGPIEITPRVHEATPERPADPEYMKGDALTVTSKTVKF